MHTWVMPSMSVKLTRMELLNTRKRLTLARRGHKLLKDKQDELMRQFLLQVKDTRKRRQSVECELAEAYASFSEVRAFISRQGLEEAFLCSKGRMVLECESRNTLGVEVPILKITSPQLDVGYGLATTPMELDNAIKRFREIVKKLILLAENEKSAELLAVELEKTRRRVNALEHILIPKLEKNVRYIDMKLEEMERSNFCNLMRIKGFMEEGEA